MSEALSAAALVLAAAKSGGGSGGTTNYNQLSNKPKINDVELSGNKSLADLGIETPDVDKAYVDDEIARVEAEIPEVPTNVSAFTNDAGYLTEHQSLAAYRTSSAQDVIDATKANSADLATVATSGDYDDLTNKPTIPVVPTNVSAFTNDAGYLTQHQDISGLATKTELAAETTAREASETALTNAINTKQDELTAGTNITIVDNVISASGGTEVSGTNDGTNWTSITIDDDTYAIPSGGSGGEPAAYIKSASVSDNTLTLTNKDDTTVEFTPAGGGVPGNLVSGLGTNSIRVDDTRHVANGANSIAIGKVGLNNKIAALGNGCIAGGYDDTPASFSPYSIIAGNPSRTSQIDDMFNSQGSIAFGFVKSGGIIRAGKESGSDVAEGAVAIGAVKGHTSSSIKSCGITSEGTGSIAMGYAFADASTATNDSGIHATGSGSIALGYGSASGMKSSGYGSVALGCDTHALSNYQLAAGRFNADDSANTYGFILGNGVDGDNRNNAFTIDWQGNGVFAGTVSSSGSDYAEFFEWKDGNPNNEDRIAYIVALDGDKLILANSADDMLGIISGTTSMTGDDAEWTWHKKFLQDKYGRFIYEDYDVVHEEGTDHEWVEHVHTRKINPDYDPERPYTPRSERPEWDEVGLLGKLYVRDDGTCEVGGYASPVNGIATKSNERTNMKVLERIDANTIRVLLK